MPAETELGFVAIYRGTTPGDSRLVAATVDPQTVAVVRDYFAAKQATEEPVPSTSAKQQRFMGAELARKRAGKSTKTKLSEEELRKFAKKRKKT